MEPVQDEIAAANGRGPPRPDGRGPNRAPKAKKRPGRPPRRSSEPRQGTSLPTSLMRHVRLLAAGLSVERGGERVTTDEAIRVAIEAKIAAMKLKK